MASDRSTSRLRRWFRQRAAVRGLAATLACLATSAFVVLGSGAAAHADEWRSKQWYLEFLNISRAHEISTGKGVTVAVLDTGVNGNHPDLSGNVKQGRDFVDSGNGWKDEDGHGTGMGSIIAGHGHGPSATSGILGIAPNASLLPVRVLWSPGPSRKAHDDTLWKYDRLEEGVQWTLDNGPDIFNMSFGGAGLDFVMQDVLKSDIVAVASAGNATEDEYNVHSPASVPGVVAVSGLNERGEFAKESAQGPEVALAAPAVKIASSGAGERGTYYAGTGTSNAAAIVSGVAALIRAKYPNLSANGVINRLISTADDKGGPGRDDKYGFGVVNPVKALTADIPDLDYNPLMKGSPGPTKVPNKNADGPRDSGGFLLPVLAMIGGLVALVFIAVGAVMFTRRRDS